MLVLERIDTAPIVDKNFDPQFLQWIWVLVDTLNELIGDLVESISSINVITDTTEIANANSNYIVTNPAHTTITLPALVNEGAQISVSGFGAGGWTITIPTGQTVKIASVPASAATSISSASRYDSIQLICVEQNTTWITLSTQTTGFVIV